MFRPGEKLLLRADYGSHFIEVTGEVVIQLETELNEEEITEEVRREHVVVEPHGEVGEEEEAQKKERTRRM